MKKIFVYIILFILVTAITGCAKKTKEVFPTITENQEINEFKKTFNMTDLSNFNFEFIGALDNGFSLYEIYDNSLEKKSYEYKITDLTIIGESTGAISKYDLFVFNKGKVYTLEYAIDYNHINKEELNYIIPDTMKKTEESEKEMSFENIISDLYSDKILDISTNTSLSSNIINETLLLNSEDYEWIQMNITTDIMHMNDIIIAKYKNKEQKDKILNSIQLRKNIILESKPGNEYFENAYKNEFFIEKDNIIIFCASENSSDIIKKYIEKYIK